MHAIFEFFSLDLSNFFVRQYFFLHFIFENFNNKMNGDLLPRTHGTPLTEQTDSVRRKKKSSFFSRIDKYRIEMKTII
jgi:hypothetical protein